MAKILGLAEDVINPYTGLPMSFSPATKGQGSGITQSPAAAPPAPPAGHYTYRFYSQYPVEQLTEAGLADFISRRDQRAARLRAASSQVFLPVYSVQQLGDGYERLASLVLSEKLANGDNIPAHRRMQLLQLSGLPDPWHGHEVTTRVFLASADELGKGGVIGDIGGAISHAVSQVANVAQQVVRAPVRIAQQIAKPLTAIAAPILKTAAPIMAMIPGVGTGIAAAAQAVAGGMTNLTNMDMTKLSFSNVGQAAANVAMGVVGMSKQVAGMTQDAAALTRPPEMQGGDMAAAGYSSAMTAAPGVGGAAMAPAGWSLPAGPQVGSPGTYVADPQTAAMMTQMTNEALGQAPAKGGKAPAASGPNLLLLGGGAAVLVAGFFLLNKRPAPALANPRRRYRRSRRARR